MRKIKRFCRPGRYLLEDNATGTSFIIEIEEVEGNRISIVDLYIKGNDGNWKELERRNSWSETQDSYLEDRTIYKLNEKDLFIELL